jgi:hypothetical protein
MFHHPQSVQHFPAERLKKRSTLSGASAASSTGGAKNKLMGAVRSARGYGARHIRATTQVSDPLAAPPLCQQRLRWL